MRYNIELKRHGVTPDEAVANLLAYTKAHKCVAGDISVYHEIGYNRWVAQTTGDKEYNEKD